MLGESINTRQDPGVEPTNQNVLRIYVVIYTREILRLNHFLSKLESLTLACAYALRIAGNL
jgi:hypothetical protein